MAVLPETAEHRATPSQRVAHRDEVLARLVQLRQRLEAVIADVAEGRSTLAQVFERSVSDEATGMVYLVKLAEVLPGVGKVRARRVLAEHGYGERTRVNQVPVDVQSKLVEALQ